MDYAISHGVLDGILTIVLALLFRLFPLRDSDPEYDSY